MLVFRMAGDLHLATVGHLLSALDRVDLDRTTLLVFDLHDLAFIDLAGLTTILRAQRRLRGPRRPLRGRKAGRVRQPRLHPDPRTPRARPHRPGGAGTGHGRPAPRGAHARLALRRTGRAGGRSASAAFVSRHSPQGGQLKPRPPLTRRVPRRLIAISQQQSDGATRLAYILGGYRRPRTWCASVRRCARSCAPARSWPTVEGNFPSSHSRSGGVPDAYTGT